MMEDSNTDTATITRAKTNKSSIVCFIKPPRQCQTWDDDQILPHVNWGDLFFDLFYVGAAYNLANVLKSDPTWEGLLYFIGCFASIFHNFWGEKMHYDARFSAGDDIAHLLWDVAQLTLLGTAVLNIRPVEYMSHIEDHLQMFVFCLANLLGILMNNLRLMEIGFVWVVGQYSARVTARAQLMCSIPALILSLVATVYAGLAYKGDVNNGDSHERLLASSSNSNATGFVSHLPIIICATTLIVKPLSVYFIGIYHGDNLKERSVPMNIDFSLHRYGEFIMLMLGESVLSLLIVNVSTTRDYYISFYAGVLSVILLQLLHYKSQPNHADDHAMRKGRTQGIIWFALIFIYSAALIVVGVSYKMILTEHTDEFSDEVEHTNVARDLYSYNHAYRTQQDGYHPHELQRFLVSGGGGKLYTLSTEERHQRISNIFCAGLATVFFCQVLMMLCHHSFNASLDRCHIEMCPKTKRRGAISKVVVCLLFCHVATIAFIGTVCLYVNNPTHVALLGLLSIVLQVSLRIMGSIYFPPVSKISPHDQNNDDEHDQDENVTGR